jgi:ganglioside GM2 activator
MYLTADSKTDVLDLGTLRVSRRKKNSYVVTGTVRVGHNVGNSVMVKYELFRKRELEDKYTAKLMGNEKTPFCDLIRDETSMYPKIIEVSNLPPQDECPFPKVLVCKWNGSCLSHHRFTGFVLGQLHNQ